VNGKVKARLQPHQQQVLERTGTGGQILNWGLGSGKTLGAITMAEKRGGRVLVVTPASLRTNFKTQLAHFVSPGRIKDYTIVSYEKFRKNPQALVDTVRPNTLIVDEFHRLRNPQPRVPFEAVRHSVPFMVGLTGSLINNRPEEIVPLVNLAAGKKVFKSVEDFQKQHIEETKVGPGFIGWLKGARPGIIESMKNKASFKKSIEPHVHRFTGSPEYQKHTPRVTEDRVEVVMTPEQESMYKALSTRNPVLAFKMRHNLPPSKKDLKQMNAFLTAARQIMNNPSEYTVKEKPEVIAGSPKFQRMLSDVQERSKNDPNFRGVIYSNFLDSGVLPVTNELNRLGVPAATFTGNLNDKQRQQTVNDLNKGRIKVLGLSPAGGEGLDLKGIRLVQLTEEHWNPERAQQAVGRSTRYKSHSHLPEDQRRVDVRRYIAVHNPTLMNKIFGTKRPTSADEWIDQRRREKLELNRQFLGAIPETKVAFLAGAMTSIDHAEQAVELAFAGSLGPCSLTRR
jgi:SNF2 family DNA or RNA helicase